jgi:enoyl-CoA hydratase
MIYTGEPVSAQTALQWGMVSEVLEPEALMPRASELAATIASRAPVAAQTAKLNLRAALSIPLENCIQYERDLQTVAFATDDAAEGIAAFKAKRAAVFTGN